jgi:16S rRNA (adenine1518-N6/adenine1519-N6)-dimethyltransferase
MIQKKSLGQNFLKSISIVRRIVKAGEITSSDFVIEIGPGKGILTGALLETGATVVTIEKDSSLIPFLQEKFQEEIMGGQLILVEGDILKFSVKEIFDKAKKKISAYKLCANIPYYITGEIIRKFLEESDQPENMVLLLQREVAKRIVASDKKESILSLSVKVYGKPKYIETVKKTMFTPAPKVDSAVLLIENISKENFASENISSESFFKVIKRAFAHKRKKLSGNLKGIVGKEILEKYKDNRAEDLTLVDWINLSK